MPSSPSSIRIQEERGGSTIRIYLLSYSSNSSCQRIELSWELKQGVEGRELIREAMSTEAFGCSFRRGEPICFLCLVCLPWRRERQLSYEVRESVNLFNRLSIIINSQRVLIISYLSTMSSLAQQLQTIRNSQRSLKVTPNQAQPTLLLDTHTATTTSSDLIFTMAVIAYSKLLKEQPVLKEEGEVIMSSDHRQLNRNTLTKQANRSLSQTLVRFMLKMSPFFLIQDCQKIIEYLLHNYKINVFEGEALSIIYLQYWNTSLYQKLIKNIPEKILASKMPFLLKLSSSKEPLNITFVVKSLSYSHFLMSSLIIYTLEYIKQEGKPSTGMDIQINLGEQLPEQQGKTIPRADPRRFLLQIFNEFMTRKMNSCYKYILEFCGKALSSGKIASPQTCSMVMILCTRLFVEATISDQLLQSIIRKLLKAAMIEESILKPFFDFLLIIWQRKPSNIQIKVLQFMQESNHFQSYLSRFKCSLWMILMDLIIRWNNGSPYPALIQCIGLRVKKDDFYLLYGEKYLARLFDEFEKAVEGSECPFLVEFLKNNFQYETGQFYNKKIIQNQNLKKSLVQILPKESFKFAKNHSIIVSVKSIQKQKQVEHHKELEVNFVPEESSEEQVLIQRSEQQEKFSLISLLQAKGAKINAIKYNDSTTKEKLMELIEDYYEGKGQLSQQQKNSILEHYMERYSGNTFQKDLEKKDFMLPIKYLSTTSDINSSKYAITLLTTDINLIDDILYRELFRLSLNHLATDFNKNYKQNIYFLNNFFKKMMNKYLVSSEKIEKLKLSEVLMKVSEQTLGKIGIKRGKYQKLIHNHGKIIAELIVGIKQKKRVTKQLNEEEKTVLEHYLKLVKIYKSENLYLLNIGIIEILTRRELDHGYIRYFITKILLGGIRQSAFDFYDLGLSLAKSIVFCSQLASSLSLKELEIDPIINSGIAKKTIVQFYGLIKEKFKRVIIKKMLLYIRSIFNNTYFIETFKLILVELQQASVYKLLELFTEFYRILSSISTEDTKILQFKQTITDQLTNLFPLDLKLTLFQPLLPNQHIYNYLSNQLEEHSPLKTQYSKLGELLNVLPEEITFQWVKFVRECLKRGNKPSTELIHGVLGMIDLEENLSVFAQLICDIAQYDPEILYPHLQTCIKVFEKHCEAPNDFTLALVARLIKSLGEMVDPYLDKLVLASLNFSSQFTQDFISSICSHLTTSTLIKFIKQNHKKTANNLNFYKLFNITVMKGLGDSLNKTLLNFTNRTLLECFHNEENPQEIVRLSSEVFLNIALKMNEHQLRKYIIDLVRWSEMKSEVEDSLPFNYRKISVVQIFSLMAEKLQSLFTPFYGYIFDSLIKDLQAINKTYEGKQKSSFSSDLKRPRQTNTDYRQTLIELYLSLCLKSLETLFKNDSDHQFLDSVKNQALADPLIDLALLCQVARFEDMIEKYLNPCLVTFHRSIVDDYQMKSINFKLLILMKRKNNKLHQFIFSLFDSLIDALQDRFLLLVSDLVPFLIQSVSSRQEGIAKTVRRIIGKIEELSGEQITSYTR